MENTIWGGGGGANLAGFNKEAPVFLVVGGGGTLFILYFALSFYLISNNFILSFCA